MNSARKYKLDKDVEVILKTKAFSRLGGDLQLAGIAVDQREAYFGIYSFQEIETYKNTKRYVTFVDMSDFSLTYKDNYMSGSRVAG